MSRSLFALTNRLARIRDCIFVTETCDGPLPADINAANLVSLTPRPECGAGGVSGGLGEGAKPDAPAFSVTAMSFLKSRNRAPKARNMKARGKRKAKRSASPLVRENDLIQR